MDEEKQAKYSKYQNDRDGFTNAVLASGSNKKSIIAGPGTGKSCLFEQMAKHHIENGRTKILTLSFINELVDDLSVDLHKLSDVKTLHSFARGKIASEKNTFLNMEDVISEDYEIVNDNPINFNKKLSNLSGMEDEMNFYLRRLDYYNHESAHSSVLRFVEMLKQDEGKIPLYDQIMIDEFQDFNKLEIALIDLLAQKNHILLVGDDDQSLYQFKYAHPDGIRIKHRSDEYTSFSLPFCSRSTRVILDAFKNVIAKAQSQELLQDRENKEYEYFVCPEKDLISDNNPKILIKRQVYQNTVPFYISTMIQRDIEPKEIKDTSVLVICPLRKQILPLATMLRQKGFVNVHSSISDFRSELVKGFDLLLQNNQCNLGWRIVAKHILGADRYKEFCDILKKSNSDPVSTKFMDLLQVDDRKFIKLIRAELNKIQNREPVSRENLEKVFNCLGYDIENIATGQLRKELSLSKISKNTHKNISIKVTSILGSKGLSGDYVFLANFDDKFMLSRDDGNIKIKNEDIYKFLVALTRSKIRTYIFTGENQIPTLAKWMGLECYEEI